MLSFAGGVGRVSFRGPFYRLTPKVACTWPHHLLQRRLYTSPQTVWSVVPKVRVRRRNPTAPYVAKRTDRERNSVENVVETSGERWGSPVRLAERP